MKSQNNSENRYYNDSKPNRFTTETFYTGSRVLKCSFCKQNHFSDKCTIVTELEKRKEIVWNNRLCFKCLYPEHSIKSCQKKSKCFVCKSPNHHSAICEKLASTIRQNPRARTETINTDTEQTEVKLVTSKSSVLLQTATAFVSDNQVKNQA